MNAIQVLVTIFSRSLSDAGAGTSARVRSLEDRRKRARSQSTTGSMGETSSIPGLVPTTRRDGPLWGSLF